MTELSERSHFVITIFFQISLNLEQVGGINAIYSNGMHVYKTKVPRLCILYALHVRRNDCAFSFL